MRGSGVSIGLGAAVGLGISVGSGVSVGLDVAVGLGVAVGIVGWAVQPTAAINNHKTNKDKRFIRVIFLS